MSKSHGKKYGCEAEKQKLEHSNKNQNKSHRPTNQVCFTKVEALLTHVPRKGGKMKQSSDREKARDRKATNREHSADPGPWQQQINTSGRRWRSLDQ